MANPKPTTDDSDIDFDRRTVLKTTGGLLSIAGLSGVATANGTRSKSYGDGNGLGAFLHENSPYKERPWDGEITDRRGESVVDVAVGAMTPVNPPVPDAPPELPLAFAPQVVKISPGTTVQWTWVSNPFNAPIPHDVTSLVDKDGELVLEPDAGQRFHHHDQYEPATPGNELEEDVNPTFEFAFHERGNHLYYCTPHGAPFEYHGHYNLVGMRGAVKVAGRPL